MHPSQENGRDQPTPETAAPASPLGEVNSASSSRQESPGPTGIPFKDRPGWLLLSLAATLLIGNGAYWQYRSSVLADRDSDLKKREFELSKIGKLAELRKSQNELLRQISEVSEDFAKARDAYDRQPTPQSNNEMVLLTQQLEVLKADFVTLEKHIADFEGRTPRPFSIDLVPPRAPKGLRVAP